MEKKLRACKIQPEKRSLSISKGIENIELDKHIANSMVDFGVCQV